MFSTTTPLTLALSHDMPGGVYSMWMRPPYVYLSTISVGHEFQLWDAGFTHPVFEKSLGFQPVKMVCDGNAFYFATGNERGIAALEVSNAL